MLPYMFVEPDGMVINVIATGVIKVIIKFKHAMRPVIPSFAVISWSKLSRLGRAFKI